MSSADSAKNLRRNLVFNTAGNLIYFACQWLVTGFFVKTLTGSAGLENSGLLATAMAVTNVFLTLASYGMRTYQVSDVSGKYTPSEYITSRMATIAVALLLCAGYTAILGYSAEQTVCIFVYLLYKLLESLTDVFHGCCQKNERMDVIGISYAVRGVLSVAAFVLVLSTSGSLNLALGVMTALCYAFSVFYDILGTKTYYAPYRFAKPSRVGALLLECLPLALYVFCNTASASVPRIMLERVMDTTAAGMYNLVNSPVLILQVGVAFLFTPFITMFANKLREGDKKGFLKLAALITLGVLVIGALAVPVVMLIGRWGLSLLYGAEVASNSALLVPLVICTALTSIVLFYCMLLTVERCMSGLIISNLLGLCAAFAASAPLIRAYGLFGASYASMAALLIEALALAAFGLRALKSEPKNAKE